MRDQHIRLMCITGIFTAAVFVFTAYLQIPSHTGYTHVGDAFIYLAACLLPMPYAMFVGGGGAVLADCLTGYAVWAPASLVIKVVSVLCFSPKGKRIVSPRNLVGLVLAAVVCFGGYYLYEAMLTGSFIEPMAGIAGYILQSALSSALFVLVGLALDKLNVKHKMLGGIVK